MKKILKLLPLAAISCMMVGCTSNDDAYDADAIANQKKAEYTAAFEKEFGTIASNQDWGFGSSTSSANAFLLTRSANTNSNQWGDYVNVPGGITTEEQAKVLKEFSIANPSGKTINVNWSDFFVQEVWQGIAHYKAKNGDDVTGGEHMDKLTVGDNDEDVNNFNHSNGSIMLMQNSSTSKFGYNNSTDSKRHYEYTIKEIDGNYYVGFDFYANGTGGTNMQVDRDYIYNDWIVKISPATYKNAQRIIAEDLGSIGDFDFNDVVFDVAQTSDGTVITVQAAGGTLPLYININGVEKEVHEALGVTTSTMVNTHNGTKDAPVAIFRLPAYSNNLETGVQVYVMSGSNKIILTTETGKAPAKICVSTSYVWTNEKQSIKALYPKFADYVNNPKTDWY